MGKVTINMAIFNSCVSHYKRVDMLCLSGARGSQVLSFAAPLSS